MAGPNLFKGEKGKIRLARQAGKLTEKQFNQKMKAAKVGTGPRTSVATSTGRVVSTSRALGPRTIKSRNARSISTLQGTRTAKSTKSVVGARRAAINQLFTHRGPGGKANAPSPGGSGADHG